MDPHRKKLIEARAYELWEQEGRPDGAHERHWHQAIRELESAEAKPPRKARAKATAVNSTALKSTAVKSTVAKSTAVKSPAKAPRARARKIEPAKD